MSRLSDIAAVALHPASPGAIYKHPDRMIRHAYARALNAGLRIMDSVSPAPRVECNICGWTGRRFGFGGSISCSNFQRDEFCLACGSNIVTRTLIDVAESCLDWPQRELEVADVGPSPAVRRYFKNRPHVRYRTIDRFKDADIQSDIASIDLPDGAVDRVICCHVIEHVPDFQRAIDELFRILRPGGSGLISVPERSGRQTSRGPVNQTFRGYGHVWMFGEDFASKLEAAGFEVDTVRRLTPPKKGLGEIEMFFHIVSKPS